MIATIDNASFQPIHIVLETPEEVAQFYAILDLQPVVGALDIENKANDIRKFLRGRLPETPTNSVPFWDKIQKKLKESYYRT